MKRKITPIMMLLTMWCSIGFSNNFENETLCLDADLSESSLERMCLTAPTLFCPPTYLGCPSDNLDPSNTGFPTALPGDSNCPDPITSYTDVVVSSTSCLKIVHRTWEATYPPGSASIKLHSTCQQTLYLEDNEPPVINNCPSDFVIDLSVDCDSTVIWYVPDATDDCGVRYFQTTHYSGSTFSTGTTPVTYTATDHCGNESTCTFDVTIQGSCCAPPTITCPADAIRCPISGSTDPSSTGSATATSSLNSCGTPIVTYNDVISSTGGCTHQQLIQRTWEATDATDASQQSTCLQNIEIKDDVSPVISNIPANITVTGNGSNCQVAVTWNQPTATDNCDIASFTSNYTSGHVFDEGVTTVTYTATDNCGNNISQSFSVTVNCLECNTPPTISCPSSYSACPGSVPSPTVSGTATATNNGTNCNGSANVTYIDVVTSSGPCTGAATITRVWTATNPSNSSLSTTCDQTITLQDNSVPSISNGPADITISADGNGCSAPVTWTAPTSTDNCGVASFTSTHNSGDTFAEGTTTVTYTLTDNCGQTSTYSFTITVQCAGCDAPPTIICPNNYTVCPGNPVSPSEAGVADIATASQDCQMPYLFFSDIMTSVGNCGNDYSVQRTWVAYDPETSLSTSCTQLISLVDDTAPTFVNIPADITIQGHTNNCTGMATWPGVVAIDDCNNATVTYSVASGSTFSEGTTTVIVTATDDCGNSTTDSFNVTVDCGNCNVPPTFLSCPADYTTCNLNSVPTPQESGYAIAVIDGAGCSGIPYMTYIDNVISSGPCAGAQVIERTWIATDPNTKLQSNCTQTISLGDNLPPSISGIPSDITVNGSGTGCQALATWNTPTATDNCGNATLTSNYSSGTSFNEGTTTVIYTATDNCGNTVSSSFTVTVSCAGCNTPPVISCPSNYAACVGGSTATNVTGSASAYNNGANCSAPTVGYSDAVISTGPCAGATEIQRTWTATAPSSGLTANCVQTISLIDNQAPTFTSAPQDIAVSGTGPGCIVPVTWTGPNVSDNCGAVTVSYSHPSGHGFPEGTTVVTVTATDACNNSSSTTFNVTVQCTGCNTPPSIVCPADYTACYSTSTEPAVCGTATATNNGAYCGTPSVSYSDVIVSSGPCPGELVIERTWTATDSNSGLSSSCVQTITLVDDLPPEFLNIPQDITVTGSGPGCQESVTWQTITVTDNCGTPTVTSTHDSGSYFPEGTTYVTCIATDECSNTTTITFSITVLCEGCVTPPTIVCPADYSACPGSSIDPNVCGSATAHNNDSNCTGTPTIGYVDQIISSGPCAGGLVINRTWTATDPDTGLSSSCVQVITLSDTQAPVISNMPADIYVTGNGTGCSVLVSWAEPTATDNCSTLAPVCAQVNGGIYPEGTSTVTYVATDGCGNSSSASFTITVACEACNNPPVLTCPANYESCPAPGIPAPVVAGLPYVIAGGNNCGTPDIVFTDATISTGPCPDQKVIQRTWTATDSNDPTLSVSCIQTISLVDNTPPTLANCPLDMVLTGVMTGSGSNAMCSAVATWNIPIVTDECSNVSLIATGANGAVVNSGDTFSEGTTTVTYVATDLCGNSSSCEFDVTVSCSVLCNSAPNITCPVATTICVGEPHLPSFTGEPVMTAGANCPAPIAGYVDVVLSTGPCPGEQVIQRTWTGSYTDYPSLSASCVQIVTIEDTQPVLANCPEDMTVTSETTPVVWTAPTVSDACGTATLTGTHTSGNTFTCGTHSVVYTATDNCGQSTSCSFNVIVDCLSSGGFSYCPDNIYVDCTGGGVNVDWDAPLYNNTCSDCSMGINIPGFLFMGSYGGSQYYCSISPATWPSAKAICQANGGDLAIVNNAGENSFLANILTLQSAWIGLTDVNSEGNFTWCDGSTPTYTNWYPGQPNNYNNNQDYCEMLSNGQWNDQYSNYALEYIMEIPCSYVYQMAGPQPGSNLTGGTYTVTYGVSDGCNTSETCSFNIYVDEAIEMTCPQDIVLTPANGETTAQATWVAPTATSCCSNCSSNIPGFVYMGSYGGSSYYCSINANTWQNSKNLCIANGGDLASVNSVGENNYLAGILTYQSAWIGMNDLANEGTFVWCNNDPVNYTNWYPGQPNNFNNNQHCVEMLSDGRWNDQYPNEMLECIMEIPACTTVSQIGGPSSGSYFTAGTTTTITYNATDGCGNVATCTFDVTVHPSLGAATEPCTPTSGHSECSYIDQVTLEDIDNISGDDGGYADYTEHCTIISAGEQADINLEPGFGSCNPNVVYWTAWIDYNQDGDYVDQYEFVAYGSGSQSISGVITIPHNVVNGVTTMRIAASLGGYATDPCGAIDHGEVEDYCVEVINGQAQRPGKLGLTSITTRSNDFADATELKGNEAPIAQVNLTVFPNPVSHTMNINIDGGPIESLGLYDQSGKLVRRMKANDVKVMSDVSDLPSGLYVLRATLESGEIESKRIIIAH